MTPLDAVLPSCGCCQAADTPGRGGTGGTGGGPRAIENRPGLSRLDYRIGTHATFKRAMLAAFPRRPELRTLTTREPDDPSIALVDAWATVLDVLAFYQERIANEGYLRTATERRSVVELAAEIGYQASPGVAASGFLAFELETGPGSPATVDLPRGVKVQSVPGQDETPQTFETSEPILTRPAWNRIRVHASERRVPGLRDTEAWLVGTTTNLRPGDAILLVGRERESDRGSERWDHRILTAVEPDAGRGLTRVAWDRGLGWRGAGRWVLPAAKDVRCHALRQRASLFGAAAPDWRSMPPTVQAEYLRTASEKREAAAAASTRRDWPGLRIEDIAASEPEPDRTIFLDTLYPRLVAGSWMVLQQPDYSELYRPDPAMGEAAIADDARTGFTLSAKTTRVVVDGENLLDKFNVHIRDTTVFLASEELALAETPLTEPVHGRTLEVDDPLDGFAPGRPIVMTGPRATLAVREGRHPVLATADGELALAPRDELTVTAPPVISGATRTWPVVTAGGYHGTVSGPDDEGHPLVAIPAPATAPRFAEAAVVDMVSPVAGDPGRVSVRLVDPLTVVFDRSAATVAANVVGATHGETRAEVLGSGDGSVPFQAFKLKQAPLTYVPAANPGGGASSLAVEVGGVPWHEVPAIDGLDRRDRAYVVHVADDRSTTVQFGDGVLGARLPTGIENVRAAYRVGIGAPGNLRAGQLSLLLTRPLGTRSVANPLPTAGGTEAESRDEARANAPRTVLTFERVVSLADYADFARSFVGIAKSESGWVWEGRTRLVLLTVAGTGGAVIAPIPTWRDLQAAIHDAGDPHQPFRMLPADQLTFDVEAGVYLSPGREWARVAGDVRAALLDAFSFERRELGQSVTTSEVGAAIQAVDGVLAVDLDRGGIRLTGSAAATRPILVARRGRAGSGGPLAAQLLTINAAPGGVTIGQRS